MDRSKTDYLEIDLLDKIRENYTLERKFKDDSLVPWFVSEMFNHCDRYFFHFNAYNKTLYKGEICIEQLEEYKENIGILLDYLFEYCMREYELNQSFLHDILSSLHEITYERYFSLLKRINVRKHFNIKDEKTHIIKKINKDYIKNIINKFIKEYKD
jgi:hypothetical protein